MSLPCRPPEQYPPDKCWLSGGLAQRFPVGNRHGAYSHNRSRILIIDDDKLIRDTVRTILASDGHEPVLAVDGEDGVRQFQHQPFDLVLCDVLMPHKEGLATMREIRQLSAATPIISMTGSIPTGVSDQPDFPLTNGATRTIAKPFRPRDLLALVRSAWGGPARAARRNPPTGVRK
jgi:DNA-binding response OmpR family regulator